MSKAQKVKVRLIGRIRESKQQVETTKRHPKGFCNWLQGYLEAKECNTLFILVILSESDQYLWISLDKGKNMSHMETLIKEFGLDEIAKGLNQLGKKDGYKVLVSAQHCPDNLTIANVEIQRSL